jgi:hypothetical protein
LGTQGGELFGQNAYGITKTVRIAILISQAEDSNLLAGQIQVI